MGSEKKWFPLEANPEVMNTYIQTLGVEGGATFCDVFGFDDDLLAMVPQPVAAVLLLYPITKENEEAVDQAHKIAGTGSNAASSAPFFMRQTVGNACGTVGIVHALANAAAPTTLKVRPGSVLDRFLKETATGTPDDRAQWFEGDGEIETAQAEAAQQGQTSNQDIHADIHLHFICHVVHNGSLFELDGRNSRPLNLGPCEPGQLLQRAAARAKEFMSWNPDEMNFTVVALCGEH
jgi:ubiquitin carboxyl-terminal hydrolase L3